MEYSLLAPLCFAFMGVLIYKEESRKFGTAVVFKGLSSLCFVVMGIAFTLLSGSTLFDRLVVCGLACGFVGDVIMSMRRVYKDKATTIFVAGGAVFMLCHIMYLCALIRISSHKPQCIIAGVVIGALLVLIFGRKLEIEKKVKAFGSLYIIMVSCMMCFAFDMVISTGQYGAVVFSVGAIFLLMSDVILVLNQFGQHKRHQHSFRIISLMFYYVGQLMIAASLYMI